MATIAVAIAANKRYVAAELLTFARTVSFVSPSVGNDCSGWRSRFVGASESSDSGAPSTRQYCNVSSAKVRRQVGQRFMFPDKTSGCCQRRLHHIVDNSS